MQLHAFICTNKREGSKPCCGELASEKVYRELKVWSRTVPGLQLTGTRCMGVCPKKQCTLSLNNKLCLAGSVDEVKKNILSALKYD